jgi:hypothetical protein
VLVEIGHKDASAQFPPGTFTSKKSKNGVYYKAYFTIDKSDP